MLNGLPDWRDGWPTRDTQPNTSMTSVWAGAEDSMIWNHALGVDAIIVTKDEDFAERTARTAVGPVIVWLRIGNATNRALLEWLEPRWSSVVQLLIDDNRLIEVR